jgi:hypothetical protein
MLSNPDVTALEFIWEQIAQAVDAAGPAKAQLFLAKLSLLLAIAVDDPKAVESAIQGSLRDLA